MDFDHLEQVKALADAPMAPPATPKGSAWGAIKAAGRGVVAAGAEVFSQLESLHASGNWEENGDPNDPINVERRRSRQLSIEYAKRYGDYARSLRPDPATAGTAEQVLFGLSKGLTKAVTAVTTMGPAAGAVAFGGSEAASTYTDLRHEGVDSGTAGQAAAVSGVLNAAGVLLPMAGPTLKATAGLYLAGGPGGYMAQQALTREVLSRAGYDDIGKKYDPLDPVGLTLSALIPLPFAAHGALRNVRAAKGGAMPDAAPAAEPAAAAKAPEAAPHEAVDAAMVHNLTLLQEKQRAAKAVPDSEIVNAIDRMASPQEKVRQLQALTVESQQLVGGIIKELNDLLPGTKSSDNVKAPEKILEKSQRPSILAQKPWHGVEHIRDSYRFKTVLDSIEQLPAAIDLLISKGIEVVKPDTAKVLAPKDFGWRIAAFDLRMPNGQLVEWYLPIKELEHAKKNGGHQLFEEVRNLDLRNPEHLAQYEKVAAQSRAHYQRAFDAYLARTGETEAAIRASLDRAFASASGRRSYPSAKSPALDSGAGDRQAPSMVRTAENPPGPNTQATGEPSSATNATTAAIASTSGPIVPPGARQVQDILAASPDARDAMTQAMAAMESVRKSGGSVEQFLSSSGLPGPVQNLLVGLSEQGGAPQRVAALARALADQAAAKVDLLDATANAVERLRSLTDDQIKGVETALPAPSADPVLQQTAARVQELEATAGDMLMRVEPDGTRATLADDLAAVRKEAAEGTDAELGALDADLVRVAAECAMSLGA